MAMKEIKITDFEGLQIGNAENTEAATGCTVLLFGKDGAPAGLDVRGGGPASRESELLKPMAAAQIIHAILLSGGSAFGLDAAGGVQKYLEERGIGFDVGVTKVPLVCQSDLFDLTVGRMDVRPDAAMGYAACLGAEHNNYRDGNYGAGTGASVGKMTGMGTCMKSGIGSYAVQLGDLKVGAIVAVNSLGDIYNWRDGHKVAGMLTPDCKHFVDSEDVVFADYEVVENKFVGNTTIGVVLTNAAFQKTQLCKLAGMAHDGYARSIRPVHTSADGDSIYAVSLGKLAADQDVVGALGARVMSEAILRAEGEKKSTILVAEGKKESAILEAEAEKQSAILRAEAEKEKMIREAEGEAEAILKVQQATANGLRFIKDAGAHDSVLRLKSLEALEKVADGKSTKIIIPSEIQNMAGLLTSAKELLSDK
mgnify:CR=1 FL=1